MTALVRPAPKQRAPKEKKSFSDKDASAVSAYYAARKDPFSVLAKGVRQLDPYPYPTITAKSEGVVTIQSDANGLIAGILMADPYCTLQVQNAGLVSGNVTNYAPNSQIHGVTGITQMTSLFSSFRVVAAGYEVRNLTQPINTTGRLYCGSSAPTGIVPPFAMLNSHALQPHEVRTVTAGVNSVSPSLLGLPKSSEATVQDLIQNVFKISHVPASSYCSNFKPSDESTEMWTSPSTSFGLLFGEPGTGSMQGIYNPSSATYGFDCIQFYADGLLPSTNCLEIKYILHYEGSPAINVSSGLVTPDNALVSPYMPRTAHAIDSAAAQVSGKITSVESVAEEVLRGAKKAINFAERVGATASKVLPLLDAFLL